MSRSFMRSVAPDPLFLPRDAFNWAWARSVVVGVLALASVAGVQVGQGTASGPGQVIRAAVHAVPIYATVTDEHGALVSDLGINDFAITDDGKRQSIDVFKSDVQPVAVAILVDVSPSLYRQSERVRDAVTSFVSRLLPADRAVLGMFDQVVSLDPSLTDNHDQLVRHLGDDMPFPAGTAMWDAVEAGRRALGPAEGRRVILMITDAEDNCSRADSATVRAHVEADGAMVYVIGIRGREGMAAKEVQALTRSTGGWYFELKPADEATLAMARVADELHRQYVLGFDAQTLDNRVHRLGVAVTRPGLIVRARQSYLATADTGRH